VLKNTKNSGCYALVTDYRIANFFANSCHFYHMCCTAGSRVFTKWWMMRVGSSYGLKWMIIAMASSSAISCPLELQLNSMAQNTHTFHLCATLLATQLTYCLKLLQCLTKTSRAICGLWYIYKGQCLESRPDKFSIKIVIYSMYQSH